MDHLTGHKFSGLVEHQYKHMTTFSGVVGSTPENAIPAHRLAFAALMGATSVSMKATMASRS